MVRPIIIEQYRKFGSTKAYKLYERRRIIEMMIEIEQEERDFIEWENRDYLSHKLNLNYRFFLCSGGKFF